MKNNDVKHALALHLADGSSDAPTVVIGRKVLEGLRDRADLLEQILEASKDMSVGSYRWGIIPEGDGQSDWVLKNLSFGSGPVHLVMLPDHPQSVVGDNPDEPEHAVTMALTGNGPKSKDNAIGMVKVMSLLEKARKLP